MKFHIITLFPEIVENYFLNAGVIARAVSDKIIEFKTYHLRDYSEDKHKRVDDTPYGGGPGMVMRCEPLFKCIEEIRKEEKIPVVNFAPGAEILNQKRLKGYREKIKEKEIILICGRYEGIDQRVIDELVDYEFSIGEYILSGGELPALVFIESLTRLIPGVLNNEDSPEDFERRYPVYTKPDNYHGKKIPDVLLSGNHKEIEKWRKENSK